MYQVTVMSGRKIVSRQKFSSEDEAWEYYDRYSDKYTCEFTNLFYYYKEP
jgi:hypothetical protein